MRVNQIESKSAEVELASKARMLPFRLARGFGNVARFLLRSDVRRVGHVAPCDGEPSAFVGLQCMMNAMPRRRQSAVAPFWCDRRYCRDVRASGTGARRHVPRRSARTLT